jgi:D-aspartate ligase
VTPAVVIGDVDLVRALGLAGIPSACVSAPDAAVRFSRHVRAALRWNDDEEDLVAELLAFARWQPEPPVLFPQSDVALLLTSRHRDRLAQGFRIPLAEADLIEQLVDKGRFQELARRHELPVPRAQRLHVEPGGSIPALELQFPVLIKPITRTDEWASLAGWNKAFEASGPEDLAALWTRLADLQLELLAQELVAGPESSIESYHAYVDQGGAIAGEFTGRKIRTYPASYGHSTAVEIVDLPDVAELGREVLDRLGLRGVAKADFKRDERGRLHLLEINPRFNLWHLPAAIAGVNLPALVHADLTGAPRPAAGRARSGVAWCTPLRDLRAAYVAGISPLAWLRWARRCDAISGLSWDDPLPFVRGMLWSAVSRRLPQPALARRRQSHTAA